MEEKFKNKSFPKEIAKEAKIALAFYPELENVTIDFKFSSNIKKSFMLAQPKISGILGSKHNRGYNVFISEKVTIEGETFSVIEVPQQVLIGWLGHELGHIMDYLEKSNLGMIFFGIKYISSGKFLRKAERAADTFAINHGMAEFILATKNFILNHSELSEKYKNRIKRLYLSPEETLEIVNEFAETNKQGEKELEKAKKIN